MSQSDSPTALPPGTCLIHGSFHGPFCPGCSTAALPSFPPPFPVQQPIRWGNVGITPEHRR